MLRRHHISLGCDRMKEEGNIMRTTAEAPGATHYGFTPGRTCAGAPPLTSALLDASLELPDVGVVAPYGFPQLLLLGLRLADLQEVLSTLQHLLLNLAAEGQHRREGGRQHNRE